MGKNLVPIILIVLAIGVFFTYTNGKITEIKGVQAINSSYAEAISNARALIVQRDKVRDNYNNISEDDRARLNKMLPDNIDNVRLIIDVSSIASRHGFALKNVRTSAGDDVAKSVAQATVASAPSVKSNTKYNTMTISFDASTSYENFVAFLQDIERSLRILDISAISLNTNDNGVYSYGVQLKTYWLKQ